MGLYNFKKQFVPKILDGSKRHTIRGERAVMDKVGNTMHLYTGLRQKGAQLLGRPKCIKVQVIQIDKNGWIELDGLALDRDECDHFARADGFASWFEMIAFWKGRLPFIGRVYHWGDLIQ